MAYRKALAWPGHSSSDMLDLYYHLHDEDSQQAMRALAGVPEETAVVQSPPCGGSYLLRHSSTASPFRVMQPRSGPQLEKPGGDRYDDALRRRTSG